MRVKITHLVTKLIFHEALICLSKSMCMYIISNRVQYYKMLQRIVYEMFKAI